MRLDLINRGSHLIVLDQVDEPVWMEVGDSDRPGEPFDLDLLHGPASSTAKHGPKRHLTPAARSTYLDDP